MSDVLRTLKARQKKVQSQIDLLTNWEEQVRPLSSFSDAEKLKLFDALYGSTREYIKNWVLDNREPKDGDVYLYEELVTEMMGSKVWDIIRLLEF